MRCDCGRPVQPGDSFCPKCGSALEPQANMTSSIGGHNYGSQYQAGRDIYVSSSDTPAKEVATYDAVPKWRSPFTQAILTWIGFFTGIASLLPLSTILSPVIHLLRSGSSDAPNTTKSIIAIVAFSVLLVVASAAFGLRRITKQQLRVPLIPGWALNGRGHRITLERIKGNNCPKCNGKLRYYNKATKWRNIPISGGGTRKEVTERTPVLECRRNSEHWWKVDPAEEQV